MKPTKEIIELAKRLYKLGYRQELSYGALVYDGFRKIPLVYDASYLFKKQIEIHPLDFIVIPDLRIGLLFLAVSHTVCLKEIFIDKRRSGKTAYMQWSIKVGNNRTLKADDPHEVVLKGIVQVLEKK